MIDKRTRQVSVSDRRARRQRSEKASQQPVIDEEPRSQRASRADRVLDGYPNMDTNPITQIMERMGIGETITFITTKYSKNEWRTLAGENVPRITNKNAFEGRLPRNFEKEVILSKEFVEWSEKWNEKDPEEKKEYAAEHNIEWDSDHPSEQTQKINLGYAVRSYLKIQKYRPAYSTSAARKQARELAKIGPRK